MYFLNDTFPGVYFNFGDGKQKRRTYRLSVWGGADDRKMGLGRRIRTVTHGWKKDGGKTARDEKESGGTEMDGGVKSGPSKRQERWEE